jgi:hypothetical protein
MFQLDTEQFIYLFYASAYKEADKADTVTKGSVQSHLPSEYKKKAESIYQFLLDNILIQEISKGRFSVTEQGIDTLAQNLITIDYNFNTKIVGAKVANFLLFCYQKSSKIYPFKLSEEISFDEFQEKFKALYLEERKQQELQGTVVIYSHLLLQKFAEKNSISDNRLNEYFALLKKNRKIFTVTETEYEMMEWVE